MPKVTVRLHPPDFLFCNEADLLYVVAVSLVHHDQLDILHKLRASVESEKEALSNEVDKLKADLAESEKRGSSLMERVNQLLMDKVGLQESSLDQRSAQLESERRFGEMKRTLAAKGWPPDATEALAATHRDKESLELQLASAIEKRQKVRQFIRRQDLLIQELRANSPKNAADPAEVAKLKAHIKHLEHAAQTTQQLLAEQLYVGAPAASAGRSPLESRAASWLSSQRRLAHPVAANGVAPKLQPVQRG